MDINKTKEANYSVLELMGELDALSAIDLDDEIKKSLEAEEVNLLIDLDKLIYISSAGLGVFMSYVKDIEKGGMKMILFNLNDAIYSTFELLGLHHIITIVRTKQDAIHKC